jgi:putative chitinase
VWVFNYFNNKSDKILVNPNRIKMMNIEKSTKLASLNSDELLEIQKALIALDYDCGKLDGTFGEKTLTAFNKFKADHQLTNLGEIGPTTIQILQMALAKEFEKHEEEQPHKNQPVVIIGKINNAINWINAVNWFDFNSHVSTYFTVGEVSQWSQERIVVNPVYKQNVLNLAKELDNIRKAYGPIGVTSWYRPPGVNRRVGGVPNSTHLTGSAADIYPIGGDVYKFQKWLDSYWEKALGYGAKRGFVHIDLRSQPKKIRWNY